MNRSGTINNKIKQFMFKDWLRHMARIDMPLYQYESDNMKMIYAGYSPIKRAYYARLLLNGNYQHTFLGRYWYSKIPHLIDSLNIDMIVAEISPKTFAHFQNCNGYILPVWTAIRINIDRPVCEIFSCRVTRMNYKNTMRCLRNHNLTYEILTDKNSFSYFKDRFYNPYMTKRHGEEAFIEDLNIMWKSCDHPLLMAIKENGIIVGMLFLKTSGEQLYLMRLGLLDGNKEYLNHGVIGAMYYFGILEGQQMGCKFVNLGGTRPFLTDGLTKYKVGWGGEFELNLSPTKEYLWFAVNQKSSLAKAFLYCNPFMYVNKDFRLVKFES
jgi:hypothetical protein